MVESQNNNNPKTEPQEKGGTKFGTEAWTDRPREELVQELYNLIESAPREVAVDWLNKCLLPMLEERKQGGMRESA